MAAPTFDEVMDQLKIVVHGLQELRELGELDATNLADLEDSLQAALKGEYMSQMLEAWRTDVRARVSGALAPNVSLSLLSFPVLELARVIGSSARAIGLAAEDVAQYMEDNGLHVVSRNLTLGEPLAFGGNVGDGDYFRLTVDKRGRALEGVFLEAKVAKVVADQNQVTIHQEVFELQGSAAGRDFLAVSGSGMGKGREQDRFAAADARLTANYVQNPSWDSHGVSADDTAFGSSTAPTGWSITNDWANVKARSNASFVFRGSQGVTTPWGIELEADDTLTQVLRSSVRARFVADRPQPYLVRVKVMRVGGATGTARLDFGGVFVTVDLSTLTNDEWTTLQISGSDCYYDAFKASDLSVKVGVSSLAVGTVAFDDLIVYPFRFIDGTWHAATGGSAPWLRGDEFTFTDELAGTDSVLQYWWAFRSGLPTLPSEVDATEVTAAGGRTLTFADSDPDTITASSGSFITDGYKAGMRLTVAGTSNNDGTYVIASVTATVLTLEASESLTAEGPLSATATLNATPYFTDP